MVAVEFTIGRCPGSSSEIMLFIYNLHEKKIEMAWEYKTVQVREIMYKSLTNDPEIPDSIVIYRGSMDDDGVHLEAEPGMCPCCARLLKKMNPSLH